LPDQSPTSAIPDPKPPKKKETPILDFMLEFKDKLFTKYKNTSNYHTMRKPQKPRKSLFVEPLDPSEEAFLKNATKEQVSIIRNKWLVESELSSKVIRLDLPSITTRCQINKALFDALYNLIVGVNIMSAYFPHDLLRDMPLTPTTKLLKVLSGHILPSLGVLYVLPIQVNGTKVNLSFYIFDIIEFDLLIRQSVKRLIQEGQMRKLNIRLRKKL
jgi:hypothetical protein